VTGSGARIVPRLLPERPDEPVETVPAISGGHPSPRKNQRRLAMTPYLASRRDTREIREIPYLSGGEASARPNVDCCVERTLTYSM
jgi:hypothetical protein